MDLRTGNITSNYIFIKFHSNQQVGCSLRVNVNGIFAFCCGEKGILVVYLSHSLLVGIVDYIKVHLKSFIMAVVLNLKIF